MSWMVTALVIVAFAPQQSGEVATPPAISNGWPVVSADGKQIAFISNRDGADNLLVIASESGDPIQLTHSQRSISTPSWSPDGASIRFAVFDGKITTTISVVSVDGGKPRQIGQIPGQGADLSPDGKRVIYNATGSWVVSKLFTSDLDGSNARQVTDGGSIAWNRKWSPMVGAFAFTGHDANDHVQVFVMKADGSNLEQITSAFSADERPQVPAWSPNRRELAIQIGREKGRAEIAIVDLQTHAIKVVTPHSAPYLDETPCWYPDGKRIAFQSNRTGSMQVWSAHVDGSDQSQITQ